MVIRARRLLWVVLVCVLFGWGSLCTAATVRLTWDPYPPTVLIDHFVIHQYVPNSTKITRLGRIHPRLTTYTVSVPNPRTITYCFRLVPFFQGREGPRSNSVCATWINGVERGP